MEFIAVELPAIEGQRISVLEDMERVHVGRWFRDIWDAVSTVASGYGSHCGIG